MKYILLILLILTSAGKGLNAQSQSKGRAVGVRASFGQDDKTYAGGELSFQKDVLVDRALMIEHAMVKIKVGQDFDDGCVGQTGSQFTKMLLVGETVGHVVEQGGYNALPV